MQSDSSSRPFSQLGADPAWGGVIPPAYSVTHPNLRPPFPLAAGQSRISITAPTTSPAPSVLPNLARPALSTDVEAKGKHLVAESTKVETAHHAPRTLDRFASVFLPNWVKSQPPPRQILFLPARPPICPLENRHILAPHDFPSNSLDLSAICPSLLSLPPFDGPTRPLEEVQALTKPGYYARHFTALLSFHLQSQVQAAQNATIYSMPLRLESHPSATFSICIPGIREDSPRLAIGDRLIIRGLYPAIHSSSVTAIEAEVVGMAKAKGIVHVYSPDLFPYQLELPRLLLSDGHAPVVQVRFLVAADAVCNMQDAARRLGHELFQPDCHARQWLFPAPASAHPVALSVHDEVEWIDQSLNGEQKAAVYAISRRQHSVPYLISGPPGTGKTRTLVEAALQTIANDPSANILLCAPSNTAADTLARRLAAHPRAPKLLRLNAPNRSFAEVHASIMQLCYIVDDHFQLPPLHLMLQYRMVICSTQDANMLVDAGMTNGALIEAERTLLSSLHPSAPRLPIKPRWTHLIVDEAAQALEPEVLIPLTAVLPPSSIPVSQAPTVVLCGDMHQLGPIVPSVKARDAELDISLLERLFQRPAYRTSQSLESIETCTHLVKNYRSIAPILMASSAMFYNDTLVPAAEDVSLLSWTRLPNPRVPVIFQGCDAEEDWVDEGSSWYNPEEVRIVTEMVHSLLAEVVTMSQNQIAVITPWREQVFRMRSRLRAEGLGDVDVGTVEAYQGGEFRATFLSCVRSREKFLQEDRIKNTGFFNEPKRFNVAITRAKELLVVVGNANLLKKDPYWHGFLQIMHRNHLYVGPGVDLDLDGAYISKIESSLDAEQGCAEDQGLFRAGEIARMALAEMEI